MNNEYRIRSDKNNLTIQQFNNFISLKKQKNSKLTKRKSAVVHQELKGLDIKINEWGQIVGNTSTEELNSFLNKHVTDWKLEEKAETERKQPLPTSPKGRSKTKK